jgi:bla regulator protein blaR1
MIPKFMSEMWAVIGPAVGNHLWQSTVFAIAAGLLTLVLLKNSAHVRYWLWLVASVKFLTPFSLLVGIGRHLPWPRGSVGTKGGLYFAMEVSQPFSQQAISMISHPAEPTYLERLVHLLPVLLAVWLCGFLVVVVLRFVRWRRISAAIREAVPLREGREVEALRRVERMGGADKRIEMRLSRSSLEPGIFGIARPVLVWPEGISKLLEDAHLEAILAHEVRHVLRWDNLAATIHMVVEAIFWFHPLVWWLGARLLEERERACDEEVLELGSERQVYAESILKICEFCVGFPLGCISGVTGADLKKRIARIMTGRTVRNLNLSRKFLLGTTAFLAVTVPLTSGFLRAASQNHNTSATALAYEAASIKLDETGTAIVGSQAVSSKLAFNSASVTLNKSATRDASMNVSPASGLLSGINVRLVSYIYFAYNITGNQFQLLMPQLPKWVVSDHFDIQARANGNSSKDQMRLMMQSLLTDRFKLAVHYETRRLPVFALVLTKPGTTGPQLHPHSEDSSCSAAPSQTTGGFPTTCGGIEGMPSSPSGRLRVGARRVPIGLLASTLAQMGNLDRAVLDHTGLSGNFDFTFEWTPQLNGPGTPQEFLPVVANPHSGQAVPTFQQDLQEQLGLSLERQEGPVEVLVIDHIEEPTEVQ